MKAPGTKRLKLENMTDCFQFCFNFAFEFNLRRYIKALLSEEREVRLCITSGFRV
jgi:hypothetical protein